MIHWFHRSANARTSNTLCLTTTSDKMIGACFPLLIRIVSFQSNFPNDSRSREQRFRRHDLIRISAGQVKHGCRLHEMVILSVIGLECRSSRCTMFISSRYSIHLDVKSSECPRKSKTSKISYWSLDAKMRNQWQSNAIPNVALDQETRNSKFDAAVICTPVSRIRLLERSHEHVCFSSSF